MRLALVWALDDRVVRTRDGPEDSGGGRLRAAEKCPRSLEGETPRSQDRGHFVFYPWSAVLRLGCLPAPPCVLDGRDEPWTVRAGKLNLRVL